MLGVNVSRAELNAYINRRTVLISILVFTFVFGTLISTHSIGPFARARISTDNDLLVIYHHELIHHANTEFFIAHGLHDNADFIFISNEDKDILPPIPAQSNIRSLTGGKNKCHGLGIYGEVLKRDDGALMKKYKRFIFITSAIRGPFLPAWSSSCWSEAYMGRITEKVKLVGMSYNCHMSRHVQALIWATDRVGLEILMSPRSMGSCWRTPGDSTQAEIYATQHVLDTGYEVDTMMSAFQSTPTYSRTCDQGDPNYEGGYFGVTIHPFETIFVRADRGIAQKVMDTQTKWANEANYSSYAVCAR